MIFRYVPGSMVKARSPWPLPDHLGIVGWPLEDGTMTVIDNAEGGVQVRTTGQFGGEREIEFLWTPMTADQQNVALSRAYSQLGHAFDLFRANCEHFVYWVVTGEVKSPQLRGYLAAVGILGLGVVLYNQGRRR
jgi:Lecithin retinol acyltransferase